MIRFTPIASSSAGCAYTVAALGAAPLLLDCGVSFKSLQRATGFTLSTYAGCLLSHAHGDHCKAWRELSNMGLKIFASRETLLKLPDWRPSFQIVHEKAEVHVGRWTVMPFECVHDVEGTFGYVLTAPNDGGRLVYLTDSAYSKYRIEGVTHWCVECNHSAEILRANTASGSIDPGRFKRVTTTHMSLDRLLDMFKANNLSTAQEIHLLHLSDENSDEEAFRTAVQRATGVPTYIAFRGRA